MRGKSASPNLLYKRAPNVRSVNSLEGQLKGQLQLALKNQNVSYVLKMLKENPSLCNLNEVVNKLAQVYPLPLGEYELDNVKNTLGENYSEDNKKEELERCFQRKDFDTCLGLPSSILVDDQIGPLADLALERLKIVFSFYKEGGEYSVEEKYFEEAMRMLSKVEEEERPEIIGHCAYEYLQSNFQKNRGVLELFTGKDQKTRIKDRKIHLLKDESSKHALCGEIIEGNRALPNGYAKSNKAHVCKDCTSKKKNHPSLKRTKKQLFLDNDLMDHVKSNIVKEWSSSLDKSREEIKTSIDNKIKQAYFDNIKKNIAKKSNREKWEFFLGQSLAQEKDLPSIDNHIDEMLDETLRVVNMFEFGYGNQSDNILSNAYRANTNYYIHLRNNS